MFRTIVIAAGVLAVSAPALADTRAVVSLKQTNLADVAAVEALHRQIAAAAVRVCAREMDGLPAQVRRACVADTMSRAIAAIDAPLLSAINAAAPAGARYAQARIAALSAPAATAQR